MPTPLSTILASGYQGLQGIQGITGPSNNIDTVSDTSNTSLFPVLVNTIGVGRTPKANTSSIVVDTLNGLIGIGAAPVTSKGTFQVGTLGYTDTGTIAGLASSVAGYNQVVFQNTNSGTTASVNLNVSNDSGTATTNYGEFGMNSSTFTGSGAFNTAGNVYLAAASTDLAIGTYSSKAIRFVINNSASDSLNISSFGLVNIPNGTSGAAAVDAAWVYRLTSNGSAIGATIADAFATPSSIALEAASVYEIKGWYYFTKTTAGTATWTNTFSSAPTLFEGSTRQSAITGLVAATGAAYTPLLAYAYAQGAATVASAATGSLTTAVNHVFNFQYTVITNAATNWRLRLTQSAGTATPLAGSYYTIRKISATTGALVA